MKCPKCGFESQSKFCPECGTPMQAQPAPVLSIPPVPTPTPYGQPPLNPVDNPAKRVSPPPRGRKPAVLVIAVIVACVVLAGIVIAVGSGIFYHKTLINATTERNKPDIIEQPYDYQTDTEPDYYFNSLSQPGEPFDFVYGTLTLTSVTNKDGDYTFSGELLNSTLLPQSYIIKDIRMSANHTPDFTIQFDKKTRDGEKYNSTEFELEPGEKTTFTFAAKGPKESGETDFSIYVQFYNDEGLLSDAEVAYFIKKADIKE